MWLSLLAFPALRFLLFSMTSRVCASAKRVSQWPERLGDIGVVKDLAIHDIDVMRYLFDSEPKTVYAKVGRMKRKHYEDYAQIILEFKENKSAFIEANWLTQHKTRVLTVTGSKAIMKLDYITQELTIEDATGRFLPTQKWIEPLKTELRHFASCVLEKKEPLINGFDGLMALQIAEKALESSRKGKVIKIKK